MTSFDALGFTHQINFDCELMLIACVVLTLSCVCTESKKGYGSTAESQRMVSYFYANFEEGLVIL